MLERSNTLPTALLISQVIHFQVLNAIDNLKTTTTSHSFLDLNKNFTELKISDKSLFWHVFEKVFWPILTPILPLIRVRGWIVNDNFSLIQVNHILRIRSISHCLDISHVFLYLIFRHFKFIDAIKTVTLFMTYTHL